MLIVQIAWCPAEDVPLLPMKRGPVILVLWLFVAVLLAPAYVLIDFTLHQDRIARELCVQRDVVEAMRTCHGHCELSKRFRQLEHEAQAGFPVERLEHRLEPLTPLASAVTGLLRDAMVRPFPHFSEAPIHRSASGLDHVPRS